METQNKENPHKNKVHRVLARSYALYFFLFLIGTTLDLIFHFKIFSHLTMMPIGVLLIALGTFLILWAQHTSRNLKKQNISKENFSRGPYHYTRGPTHWGLFLLMLGFGIIANAVFIILTTLISFLISRLVFLDKQEKILEGKYGTHYREYKKIVNL